MRQSLASKYVGPRRNRWLPSGNRRTDRCSVSTGPYPSFAHCMWTRPPRHGAPLSSTVDVLREPPRDQRSDPSGTEAM